MYNPGHLWQLLLSLQDMRFINSTWLNLGPVTLVTILDMRPWTPRSDGFGIDISMTLAVVLFDVLEVSRLFEFWMIPVHALEPVVQDRILASDHTEVAFKVLNVDRVEADQGVKYTNINLCHVLAKYVGTFVAVGHLLELIQRAENSGEVLLVRFLVGRETSLYGQLYMADWKQG